MCALRALRVRLAPWQRAESGSLTTPIGFQAQGSIRS
jgi:hypothetical protein